MDIPQIVIIPKKLEEAVQAGRVTSGEFHVNSGNGMYIKGLAYTSHTRVKIENPAFGGMRNRISYQIDASHLEDGDQIEGEIRLVTNGGEFTLPFHFLVRLGVSGQTLAGLKEPKDFGETAKEDLETALRLFDYQDFVKAPFMQDMHVRAVYDGLKGHGDRGNQLEEFLVSLGVKEPVRLKISSDMRRYGRPVDVLEDVIEAERNIWGYVSLEVRADAPFIEIPKCQFSDRDFEENVCRISYRILPKRLHRGRNFGSIRLITARETVTVPIRVESEPRLAGELARRRFWKAACQFLKLRLDCEDGLYEFESVRDRMMRELDVMRSQPEDKNMAALWMAETLLGQGSRDQAALVLDECRDEILMSRRDMVDYYCYFQYIHLMIQPNISQKESLLRLVRKYLSEGGHPFLFFIRLKLDETVKETPVSLLSDMRRLYEDGFHSPFLYTAALDLLKEHPEFIQRPDSFLLQVLNFGSRRGILDEDSAVRIAQLAGLEKHYSRMFHRILVRLYETYPRKEILAGVCGMMIKGECRKPEDFHWYETALEEGLSLTRLYEYFLYSLPKDYNHLLPKEVLLYFSYGHDLDRHSRSVLYKNILLFMNPSSNLYRSYERDMEQFALDQLFQSRINSRLAVIYDHMIYKDMIDEAIAKVLPAVLRSYRISCRSKQMKYVIIRYEELEQENAYLLTDGVAYVPLFSGTAVILFQDAFGNRYADVQYLKTPVMDKADLEKKCFEIYPAHPMLCLTACKKAADKEMPGEEEIPILERAINELSLCDLYRKQLLGVIIGYYRRLAGEENSTQCECSYLLTLDIAAMTRRERLLVCETLISQNYLEEAYGILKVYGCEGLDTGRLEKLCSKMILQQMFDEDDFLMGLSFQVFAGGKADSVVLDYLCEHFNGDSDEMFRLLTQAVSARVETYDLEERLMCQMMFSGKTEHLDQTFLLYSKRKRMSEIVVKAYFTVKSIGYFLRHETADPQVFAYLEATVNRIEDMEKAPVIYLLALTLYYSQCRELKEDQIRLCRRMTDQLLGDGLIFPYTKKLSRFVPVPQSVMDKAMICFEGNRDDKLELLVRILPDEEEFHPEEFRRVYQGIFVCRKVLFEGETMEYQIFRQEISGRRLAAEGTVSCELTSPNLKESRFASLNDMGLCLSMKEEAGLKKSMQEYLMRNAALEDLFPLAR